MKRKTRIQIIKERRIKLILQIYGEGFLLKETGKMFGIRESRISQILAKVGGKTNTK